MFGICARKLIFVRLKGCKTLKQITLCVGLTLNKQACWSPLGVRSNQYHCKVSVWRRFTGSETNHHNQRVWLLNSYVRQTEIYKHDVVQMGASGN